MQLNWFMVSTAVLMLASSIYQYFWKGDWRLGVLYLTWCIGNAVLSTTTAK